MFNVNASQIFCSWTHANGGFHNSIDKVPNKHAIIEQQGGDLLGSLFWSETVKHEFNARVLDGKSSEKKWKITGTDKY